LEWCHSFSHVKAGLFEERDVELAVERVVEVDREIKLEWPAKLKTTS